MTAERHSIATGIRAVFLVHPRPRVPGPLLIATHGYGGNAASMLAETGRFVPRQYSVISVQGPHQHTRVQPRTGALSTGYGWGAATQPEEAAATHRHILRGVVKWAVRTGLAARTPIVLAGFSESAALNYRYAAVDRRVTGVIALCGSVPDLAFAALPHVLHLAGASDAVAPVAAVAPRISALRAVARSLRFIVHEAGHEITPAMHDAARAWLRELAAADATQPHRAGGRRV